ncbi:hypothetical protein BDN67DRAFT_796363 [Paxillus ammoniavirescens]|nr:hypothetical protein BDN67DRAFT_796363 [Paxillus ammoniavirescens]
MNGTSTYVVGLDVGALTGLEGVPESARNTPTGTATRTLRSDLSQSPALPSSNGDSSTPYRVRPNLTINPHALPNEHRRRADEGHILTPHTHLYDSPGNERALRPSSLPASNISPVSTKSHQSTASRPSVGTHRLSGAYWMDAFRGRKPLEAPVASPDGGLGDGSTSFKASTARKLRSATNPHWTDALWQSGSELPSKAPASDPPPSFDRVYVLLACAIISVITQ